MIAPKETRSSLKYPLDDILGSPGLVRLIRVLAYETESPVSVANAAGMAGLSLAGASKALKRLADLGVAERVGTGRALKFSSKQGNPFLNLLMLLFEKEHEHYQSLLTLRDNIDETILLPLISVDGRGGFINDSSTIQERAGG